MYPRLLHALKASSRSLLFLQRLTIPAARPDLGTDAETRAQVVAHWAENGIELVEKECWTPGETLDWIVDLIRSGESRFPCSALGHLA